MYVDNQLGFAPVAAAAAIQSAAQFAKPLKSLFGGGGPNYANTFSKQVGKGKKYLQSEANAIRARAQGLGVDPIQLARFEFDAGRQLSTAEILARFNKGPGPAPAAVTSPAPVVAATTAPTNYARAFSDAVGVGKLYTQAEANQYNYRAKNMIGQGIPVTGEQLARLEYQAGHTMTGAEVKATIQGAGAIRTAAPAIRTAAPSPQVSSGGGFTDFLTQMATAFTPQAQPQAMAPAPSPLPSYGATMPSAFAPPPAPMPAPQMPGIGGISWPILLAGGAVAVLALSRSGGRRRR